MTEAGRQTDEIEKNKRLIAISKKVIFILAVTPLLPIFIFVTMLVRGIETSNGVTVDERFALSSSIKPLYPDTLKGSYDYAFAFCGDPHMKAEGDGLFPQLDDTIRLRKVNFVIFNGDLTFLGRQGEYKNFIEHAKSLTAAWYTALGNHDLYNNGWEYYWRYLGPSAYSFYGGNAKFVVIDTATGEIGERQMEWIQKELKKNKQPLLFVISHMPIYGGAHGTYEFPRSEDRDELIALFEKYEVDFVLESHYHGSADMTINGVRYITSGSFSDGPLDEGPRHFLIFRIYGPEVSVEKILVTAGSPIVYRDGEL